MWPKVKKMPENENEKNHGDSRAEKRHPCEGFWSMRAKMRNSYLFFFALYGHMLWIVVVQLKYKHCVLFFKACTRPVITEIGQYYLLIGINFVFLSVSKSLYLHNRSTKMFDCTTFLREGNVQCTCRKLI